MNIGEGLKCERRYRCADVVDSCWHSSIPVVTVGTVEKHAQRQRIL